MSEPGPLALGLWYGNNKDNDNIEQHERAKTTNNYETRKDKSLAVSVRSPLTAYKKTNTNGFDDVLHSSSRKWSRCSQKKEKAAADANEQEAE